MSTTKKLAFGNKEWADETYNFQTGCENECTYCYANFTSIRYNRTKPGDWVNAVIREKDVYKKIPYSGKEVMCPSTHDITENNLKEAIIVIGKIIANDNFALIVSKPRLKCIKAICNKFDKNKDKILFRFSIGSVDDAVLKFWERNAPKFKERLDSLKWAHKKGFQTSVSCEPMLDDRVEDIINKVSPYVTATIWLGKANYLIGKKGKGRLEMNGYGTPEYINKAKELIAMQSDKNMIALYNQYKNNPKIMFKGSIIKVLLKNKIINNNFQKKSKTKSKNKGGKVVTRKNKPIIGGKHTIKRNKTDKSKNKTI